MPGGGGGGGPASAQDPSPGTGQDPRRRRRRQTTPDGSWRRGNSVAAIPTCLPSPASAARTGCTAGRDESDQLGRRGAANSKTARGHRQPQGAEQRGDRFRHTQFTTLTTARMTFSRVAASRAASCLQEGRVGGHKSAAVGGSRRAPTGVACTSCARCCGFPFPPCSVQRALSCGRAGRGPEVPSSKRRASISR